MSSVSATCLGFDGAQPIVEQQPIFNKGMAVNNKPMNPEVTSFVTMACTRISNPNPNRIILNKSQCPMCLFKFQMKNYPQLFHAFSD